jgi:hypothetical protein
VCFVSEPRWVTADLVSVTISGTRPASNRDADEGRSEMHDDDGGRPRPLAVGLILAEGRSRTEMETLKVAIVARAMQEGYSLLNVYEANAANYAVTLKKLLAAVHAVRNQHDNTRVVFVPTRDDLGPNGRVQLETSERIDENDLELVLLR